MRTTVDLDGPILRELKRLQKIEGKSLGRLVSDLLAQALGAENNRGSARPPFLWHSQPMGARLDLDDKDALNAELDRDTRDFQPSRRRP